MEGADTGRGVKRPASGEEEDEELRSQEEDEEEKERREEKERGEEKRRKMKRRTGKTISFCMEQLKEPKKKTRPS